MQTVQKTGDSTVQFFGWSSTCPLVCKRQDLVRQCRKLWFPQLHSSDKVVDVPAVAVHRQGVNVPVIIQRRLEGSRGAGVAGSLFSGDSAPGQPINTPM